MEPSRIGRKALLGAVAAVVATVVGLAAWQALRSGVDGPEGRFETPEAESARVGSELPPGEGVPYGSIMKADLPPVPAVQPGCEGECCGILATKTAKKETPLFEKPDKTSRALTTLASGESFNDARNFIKVLRFGKAIVREDVSRESEATSDLHIGDELTIVSYEGEGYYLVWAKGYKRVLQIDPPAYEIQGEGETESWVEITTKSGVKGWALAPELDWGWC